MGAEALLETMSRKAAAECDAILADARSKAGRILAEARDEAAGQVQEALAEARREAAGQLEDARKRAIAEAERSAMTHREQVADVILEKAREALARMAEQPDFGGVVIRLLEESLGHAPETVEVRVPPGHAAACEAWLASKGRAAAAVVEDPHLRDGVAVSDDARTFRVTNTLSMRLAKAHDAARRLAISRLFEGDA